MSMRKSQRCIVPPKRYGFSREVSYRKYLEVKGRMKSKLRSSRSLFSLRDENKHLLIYAHRAVQFTVIHDPGQMEETVKLLEAEGFRTEIRDKKILLVLWCGKSLTRPLPCLSGCECPDFQKQAGSADHMYHFLVSKHPSSFFSL